MTMDRPISRRSFLQQCAVASVAASIPGAAMRGRPVPKSADKPNIVFILADDVGCEPLGCYEGESYATPNIDRLAERGMRFRHCYSMPVCHPSRLTIMTGRYPFRNPAGWVSYPRLEALLGIRPPPTETPVTLAPPGELPDETGSLMELEQ